uniref:DRIM domain-containing protein n=1 Tax=Syphacia muris TaxID=451379 RepID=A0A158R5P3_9BILA
MPSSQAEKKYTSDELDALFKHFIGPSCDAVSQKDKLIAPLNILRLFFSWSHIPLLFDLFRVQIPSERFHCDNSVMGVMCNTLNSNAADSAAKESVLSAILNLLTISDEGTRDFPQLNLVDVKILEGVNFGTSVVLTESHQILNYIYESLPIVNVKKKMDMKHLEIVNRLADHVNDEMLAKNLILTFLAYIEGSSIRDDDVIQQMLVTISRLVDSVKDYSMLLSHMVKLQSLLVTKNSRLGMVSVLNVIRNKITLPEMSKFIGYICDLDAWDLTKIDEPDYEKRHIAYKNINEAIFFFFTFFRLNIVAFNFQSNDVSLRDSASFSFRRLIEFVGACSMLDAEKSQLVEKHFIPLVLKGIRSKTELIRNEFVLALVSLIAAFPTHKQFCQLLKLRNTDDVELDFFANVSHLQLHRRQRAFRRVADSLESGDLHISVEVMIRFLIPLLYPYIIDVNSNTSALSDEAIHLFWTMLEYYLNRQSRTGINRKANLRIIVALIEAFHFNAEMTKDVCCDDGKVNGDLPSGDKDNSDNEEDMQFDNLDNEENEKESMNDALSNIALPQKSSSDNIMNKVIHVLLPKLRDCAIGKNALAHRKAASNNIDDDEVIERVPVALATVKLLQKMPSEIMDQYLEGVILKMCDLLMSRSIHVRECARKTLAEILDTLGPKYLPFIIREVKLNLSKGYQVSMFLIHVMIYSMHLLISGMQDRLSSGDLDSCLDEIVEVCKMELFGDVAEEKEVGGIIRNVPEAKGHKTFETYTLLGHFISAKTIGLPVLALKEILKTQPNAEAVKNVSQLLKNYASGVSTNIGIDALAKTAFAYHMINDHVGDITSVKSQDVAETRSGFREPSCLLLDKEPGRVGVVTSKTSLKSRNFVFVEFGLQILGAYLKSRKSLTANDEDIAQLDPFVLVIQKCLELKYEKIVSNALRCFVLILKYPLPSLKTHIQKFVDRLYILLAEYSSMGVAGNKGVMLELIVLVFKALTQMIKDAPTVVLSSKRLQLLLSYIEADIMDSHKQATAFSLLKAIIHRKFVDAKVKELINYLSELAITSELPHIRVQCRQVIAYFVSRHPQSDKPKTYVEFFLNQLEYEHESGRISAIEMLNVLFETFNEGTNDQYCILAFVKMAVRLINDESPKCRRLIAFSIRKLLSAISESKVNDIYLSVRDWLQSKKEQNVRIAMLIAVEFVEVFGEKFGGRLSELMPLFITIFESRSLIDYTESTVTTLIDSFTVILQKCPKFSEKYINNGQLEDVLKLLEIFVKCPQSNAVQLSTSRLIGQIFSLANEVWTDSVSDVCINIANWMCWQLKNFSLTPLLAEQASKNLIYVSNIYITKKGIEALALLLRAICKYEIIKRPAETVRRSSVFKILAVFVLRSSTEELNKLLDILFPYVFREMNQRNNESELCKLAMEVGDLIKQKIKQEEYSRRLSEAQVASARKAEKRKMLRKEEAITDPVKAALRKTEKTQKRIAKRKLKARNMKFHGVKKLRLDN